MKLYTTDNSELMEIASIRPDGSNLIVEGTIMGAMPVRAILKPAEIRAALRLMPLRTKLHAVGMLLRSSR